jgi:hypothetical protein
LGVVGLKNAFQVEIAVTPLPPDRWRAIKDFALNSPKEIFELLKGRPSFELIKYLLTPELGVFPEPNEIVHKCSCPNGTGGCQHFKLVFEVLAEEIQRAPELIFVLRGLDLGELMDLGRDYFLNLKPSPKELSSGLLAGVLPSLKTPDPNSPEAAEPTFSPSQIAELFDLDPASLVPLEPLLDPPPIPETSPLSQPLEFANEPEAPRFDSIRLEPTTLEPTTLEPTSDVSLTPPLAELPAAPPEPQEPKAPPAQEPDSEVNKPRRTLKKRSETNAVMEQALKLILAQENSLKKRPFEFNKTLETRAENADESEQLFANEIIRQDNESKKLDLENKTTKEKQDASKTILTDEIVSELVKLIKK